MLDPKIQPWVSGAGKGPGLGFNHSSPSTHPHKYYLKLMADSLNCLCKPLTATRNRCQLFFTPVRYMFLFHLNSLFNPYHVHVIYITYYILHITYVQTFRHLLLVNAVFIKLTNSIGFVSLYDFIIIIVLLFLIFTIAILNKNLLYSEDTLSYIYIHTYHICNI